jgi:hypothetical protein
VTPTPADCDGSEANPCGYGPGQIGELNVNLNALLAAQKGNTTPFIVEPQGASIYVNSTGPATPDALDPAVRQLERDTATVTADNPYSGVTGERITNWLAGETEEGILHLVNADPARTPTFSLFPKPDYFFGSTAACTTPQGAGCVAIASRFAWDHGYYTPNIDITWAGMAGPGVKVKGIDGPDADDAPAIHHPNGEGLVPDASKKGTWVDMTDIRPTLLALTGIAEDGYVHDGRVLTELMKNPTPAKGDTKAWQQEARCYKQLNASVGEFGTDTLVADTAAIARGDAQHDRDYGSFLKSLDRLGSKRDKLAEKMKQHLFDSSLGGKKLNSGTTVSLTVQCEDLLDKAHDLAHDTTSDTDAPAATATVRPAL